ncbi:MAG: hypothetical protein U9Q77_08610 [Candidatus Marinimicrobia bacterium]|nr:hypothetical protein [Candidatus Neomarinimicrobiota bacterium]
MEQAILPAFQDHWLKQHEERVEFITTFAGSGGYHHPPDHNQVPGQDALEPFHAGLGDVLFNYE